MNIKKAFFAIAVLVFTVVTSVSCIAPVASSQTCALHKDANKDLKCDVCGSYVPVNCTNHQDANHDSKCDTNGCTATLKVHHYDENHDGKCDEPLCTKSDMSVIHEDGNLDRICDVCGGKIASDCKCHDNGGDGYCDNCGYEIPVCDHVDASFDGMCDLCKAIMENSIPIYENGKLNFTMVLASGAPINNAMIFDSLVEELEGYRLEVIVGKDTQSKATDYEIYFGTPTARDDIYKVDPHLYGMKGYSVQLIGTKIIIVSGSDGSFDEAVDAFKETFLGITPSTRKLTTRYISELNNISEIQDDYDVNAITLLGSDIKGFTIAADKSDEATYPVALTLQEMLYSKVGYWLDIVPLAEADKSIVIKMQPKNFKNEGFYATFIDGKMEFVSEYPTVVYDKVISFFTAGLEKAKASGTLAIEEKDSFTDDVRDVYYSDFGARGDGVTDDLAAIIAAHEYANAGGHRVVADKGATYYIGNNNGNNHYRGAIIQTDTVWTGASFIIDDSVVSSTAVQNGVYARQCEIFCVKASKAAFSVGPESISVSSLMRGDTSIGYAPGFKAIVCIKNENQKNYIRYGANANSGEAEQEVILVDENGIIDDSTPLMWDYETVTGYTVYYIDDEPITISGGSFTTVYNRGENVYTPYSRGIWVRRSNVTIKDVSHVNIGEGETGCPSGGFTIFRGSYNLLFENIVYDNMKSFYEEKNGQSVLMGSYEIAGQQSIGVTWKNCTQLDFWRDEEKRYAESGGIMGTSYNRNLTFDGCTISSFDAHAGVYNVTIKDSEIEHINCIGGGVARIENTRIHTMYQKNAINLRSDYGSLWMGDFYFIDCTLITEKTHEVALFDASWYNHDFGFDYGTSMPTRVFVENITIDSEEGLSVLKLVEQHVGGSSETDEKAIWTKKVWENTVDGVENVNPYSISAEWIITDNQGYNYLMPPNFATKISIERENRTKN